MITQEMHFGKRIPDLFNIGKIPVVLLPKNYYVTVKIVEEVFPQEEFNIQTSKTPGKFQFSRTK